MKKSLLAISMAFFVAFSLSAQKANFTNRQKADGVQGTTTGSTVDKASPTKKYSVEGKTVKQNNHLSTKAVIFSETFSGGALPAGWSNVDNNASTLVWSFNNPGGRPINTTTSADGFAIIDSDDACVGSTEDADLITPAIDCSASAGVKLSFEHYFNQFTSSTATVSVSGDNGANWTTLESWTTTSTNAAVAEYNITAIAAGQSQVKIKWNWQGDCDWYWAIDDVAITETFAHDLAVTAITPSYVTSGSTAAPVVTVSNQGTSSEAVYSVQLTDGSAYTQTVNVTTAIAPDATYDVTFPSWTPADGNYTLTATVTLTGDAYASNDEMNQECYVGTEKGYIYDFYTDETGALTVPTDQFNPWGYVSYGFSLRGFALKGGILYAVTSSGDFGTVSKADGSFNLIGATGITCDYFTNLAYDPNTGVIYLLTLTGSYPSFTIGLYTIEPTTGVGTLVANSSHSGAVAMFAFDRNSNLYAIEHVLGGNGLVYSMNETTAEMTLIGDIGEVVSSNFQAMAWDFNNDVMIFQASPYSSGEMQGSYTINLTTGAATLVGVPFLDQVMAMVIPSNDSTLSDLKVGGTTVTGFSASTITYNVELPIGTTVVPTVTATTTEVFATKTITNVSALPGSTTVVVTAQDGTTTKTYTISFTVAAPSTDATLSDLKVSGATVTGFSASTITYSVELPYGTTAVPSVTATTADANATKVITAAPALPGSTTVVVTAQDGTTTKTYTINFTVAVQKYAVTFSVVNGNGTLTATVDAAAITSPSNIATGKSVVFTASPASNYTVKEWKLNGTTVPSNSTNNYTLSNLSANSIVTVEFMLADGINDVNENSLSIYPIPASDVVKVKMKATIEQLEVVSINGQVLLQSTINNNEGVINTSELRNGIYFLRILTSKGVITKKIQISK